MQDLEDLDERFKSSLIVHDAEALDLFTVYIVAEDGFYKNMKIEFEICIPINYPYTV